MENEVKKKGKSVQFYVRLIWAIFLIPIISFATILILISKGVFGFMPTIEELENPRIFMASEVISTDGQTLGKYYFQNRTMVDYSELSPYLVDALIATEDIRFRKHSGIDERSLARVIIKTLALGQNKGGGSTITQQLAKNLFPRESMGSGIVRFINLTIRKFKEWIIAIKLERHFSKDEIIALYYNKFDFLNQAVGIKSAAKVYFNSEPDSLNIQQAAMLVGMAKNPAIFNPIRNADTTLFRRNVVFEQLLRYDYITEEEFDSLKQLPLQLDYQKVDHNLGPAPYLREYLRMVMQAKKPVRKNYATYENYRLDSIEWETDPLFGWCNKNLKPDGSSYNLYKDGLKIYTTINSKMQKYAEEAVAEHMRTEIQPKFDKEQKNREKAPFSWMLSKKDIDDILINTMKRSERYRILRESGMKYDSIVANFNTPVSMKLFAWAGDIDTILSPWDSIRYTKRILRASFMSVEPSTGQVRAYVGGIDYRHFKYDQVKVARRQVGSTFKPFIYTLAMQEGLSPCYKVPNIEVSFKMPPGHSPSTWTPQFSTSKYLKKYDGKMISLKFGLAHSLNQISAWVMRRYNSPEAVVTLTRKMGVKSKIDPVLSLCVGSAEVSLWEMVGAYSTFVNQGIHVEPIVVTRIEDKEGNIISTFQTQQNQAISEETAYLMIELMKGVVDIGTSKRLRYKYKFKNEMAGKTGTTNDNSDGWFIGYTPNLISGAWVGGEERSIRFSNTNDGQGATLALPMWALYMQKVYADKSLGVEPIPFPKPNFPITIELDCNKYEENENYDPDDSEMEYENFEGEENQDDEDFF